MNILNFSFKTSKPTDSTAVHTAVEKEQGASLEGAHANLAAALSAFDLDPSQAHESAVLEAKAVIEKIELHTSRTLRLKAQAEEREQAEHVKKVEAEAATILAAVSISKLQPAVNEMHKTTTDLARAMVETKIEQRALARHRRDERDRASQMLASIGKSISTDPNAPLFFWDNGGWPGHAEPTLTTQPGDSTEMQQEIARLSQKLQGW